ncbi:transposase IS4 protein (macronuclear) [Tetrahymena thermophila SB210]|uniref:Transposase IS4 protein n=1 Tax=Tetrahymena thermophila (strain SB210) TaxID=312017 RepID=Q23AY6_TETTS|nr:transposase IS4 protein [Tetrahymena thermophila SB210]EAR93698.3 transposase IS4 protein [Tetrahymena thermophila SB210]|eukprot:XP_001013943.3 transposase IS4 protein [Tetrahymena thermophila SB210]
MELGEADLHTSQSIVQEEVPMQQEVNIQEEQNSQFDNVQQQNQNVEEQHQTNKNNLTQNDFNEFQQQNTNEQDLPRNDQTQVQPQQNLQDENNQDQTIHFTEQHFQQRERESSETHDTSNQELEYQINQNINENKQVQKDNLNEEIISQNKEALDGQEDYQNFNKKDLPDNNNSNEQHNQDQENMNQIESQEGQNQLVQIEVNGSVNSLQENNYIQDGTFMEQEHLNDKMQQQQEQAVKEETEEREEMQEENQLHENQENISISQQNQQAHSDMQIEVQANQINQQENQLESLNDKEVVKEENNLLLNILSDENNKRFQRLPPELSPNIFCHFLGGKSLQLTNINDSSRLFMYFLGTKILRQLLNKANVKLREIYKKQNDVKEYTIEEIQVYQALKILMGLQQNSSNFDFFLLKDLQKIPPYHQLFTNERFQFLLDCERELNKDILNNEQLIQDFVQRAQNSQTSDQELVLISKKGKVGEEIIHNNSVYTQIFLCELSSAFVFGYFVVKDMSSFANQICINLESFTNQNHHVYFQNEEFFSNYEKIQELLNSKIHISSFLNNKFDQFPQSLQNEMLHNKPLKANNSETIFDRQTQTQLLIKSDENLKKEVFLTTSGTVKQDKMVEKHKQAIQKITQKLRMLLTEYRFVSINNDTTSIFEELSEIAIQNSYIIYSQAKEKMDYRLFRFKLAQDLLQKQIQKIKQEELQNVKSKLIDVEVQTDKVVESVINVETHALSKSPKSSDNNEQFIMNEVNSPVFQGNDQNIRQGGTHVQKKDGKQGICLVCLQEKNIQNNTFITCQECSLQNKKPVYLCDKCFEVYHLEINVNRDNFDKKNFSRLSTLKNSVTTVPIDKMAPKPLQNGYGSNGLNGGYNTVNPPIQQPLMNNGYNGYQPQQTQVRRRRTANIQDGYETSGPAFNSMVPPQMNGNMMGQQIPLKRRGPALDDSGFRSDAPSSYIPATRGRKKLNHGQDQLPPRNQYGYSDLGQPNNMNGYGQGMGNNATNGYDRYSRGVDMNGYTTSDPAYGRNYQGADNYNNNQIYRGVGTQRK